MPAARKYSFEEERRLFAISGVYFIHDSGVHAIKIGYSDDIKRRFLALQVAHAIELRLLGILPNATFNHELVLHRRFAELRMMGEWFRAASSLTDFIRECAHPFPEQEIDPEFPPNGLMRCVTCGR